MIRRGNTAVSYVISKTQKTKTEADIYDKFRSNHYQLTKLIDEKIATAMSCFANKAKIMLKMSHLVSRPTFYELLHLIQNEIILFYL